MRRRYARDRDGERDASQFLLSCYRLTLLSLYYHCPYLTFFYCSSKMMTTGSSIKWKMNTENDNGAQDFFRSPTREKHTEFGEKRKKCTKKCHIFHSLVLPKEKRRRKYRNQRPLMRHVHFHLTCTHTRKAT